MLRAALICFRVTLIMSNRAVIIKLKNKILNTRLLKLILSLTVSTITYKYALIKGVN